MLVSAGAGLDSSIKQLFKGTIEVLIFSDDSVCSNFEKFVVKALGKGNGELDIDTKLLAKALITPFPIVHLADRYLYELTGSSLQSADQLFSAACALGLDPKKDVKLDEKKLKPVFDARNKIVHEFDIDFTGARRNRIQRRAEDMVDMANELLLVSQKFVELVFGKLPKKGKT